uniref:Uncharacterized protein n=1 Tax=Tanacetum cinerariifolium TaxID=118510 RepID=A0A6L2JDM0_TANCI|nr:hypothetical protein [Tanacetum cinerariifolium]
MSKEKERCIAYFRYLHSRLQILSKEDLKGTRIEHRFKRAFLSLFGQANEAFTSTMFLNDDQLQKKLNKDEFQEDGSMLAFWVINRQFQKFIDSQFTLDYDNQMTDKYFAECTGIEVKQFREALLQYMGNVKNKSGNDTNTDDADIRPIYDEELMTELNNSEKHYSSTWVMLRGLLLKEYVIKDRMKDECGGIKSEKQDESSRSGNDIDIRPIYDEEPIAKELNSQAKIQSYKTRNRNKPVDQKSHTQKPGRQIFTRHRFSPNKSSTMYEKTSSRYGLRWKYMGRIFNTVGLRWIPIGKLLDSFMGKVDSELPSGSNVDISKIHECKQTLDLSACTLLTVVSKSSTVPTANASDKRQQQPNSTSSTSTLGTTVTADGNFDF